MNFKHLEKEMKDAKLFSFNERRLVPETSGVYTAWLSVFGECRCLYVGKSSNLSNRVWSHFTGKRGGDQFCLYVYDRYVHDKRPLGLSTPEVDKKTGEWIRRRTKFRWVELPEDKISRAEKFLRKNWKPILNPL